MQIVIDISEDFYRRLKAGDTNAGNTFHNTALEAIGNGIPLPKGHGELIDKEKPVISSEKISCPKDLNQYLVCEPLFENTFPLEDCESKKFYGDCYHCFASSIAKRDRQIRQSVRPQGEWIVTAEDNESVHRIQCPFCGYEKGSDFIDYIIVTFEKFPPFCENCGAELRGNSNG